MNSLQIYVCEGSVKNNVGRDRRPNVVILECFVCRECGKTGKVGWY